MWDLRLHQIPLKNLLSVALFPFTCHLVPGVCCDLHSNLKANSTVIFRVLNVTFSVCV